MWGVVRGIVGDRRTLAERYTQELSEITAQIHTLERALASRETGAQRVRFVLTYYGTTANVLAIAAAKAWFKLRVWILVAIFIVGCVLIFLARNAVGHWTQWRTNCAQRQLAKLKARHQHQLDKLKEETNYHAASALIQRFSSGEDGSDDAAILMDEELQAKARELRDLQQQLSKLQQEDSPDRAAWFDKVIELVAGSDDLPQRIVCSKCGAHTGAYKLTRTQAVPYVCPECGFRMES